MSHSAGYGESPGGERSPRDPRVWRRGLAAAREALRALGADEEPDDVVAGPVEDPTPVTRREGVAERARRIAAWVNGVGDPAQFDDRR